MQARRRHNVASLPLDIDMQVRKLDTVHGSFAALVDMYAFSGLHRHCLLSYLRYISHVRNGSKVIEIDDKQIPRDRTAHNSDVVISTIAKPIN